MRRATYIRHGELLDHGTNTILQNTHIHTTSDQINTAQHRVTAVDILDVHVMSACRCVRCWCVVRVCACHLCSERQCRLHFLMSSDERSCDIDTLRHERESMYRDGFVRETDETERGVECGQCDVGIP